jgi:SAM-dependent methyltransferase
MSDETRKRHHEAPLLSNHDVITTNMSYYILYQTQINKDDDSPWHVDEWTRQDTLEAERVLQNAQERCNISIKQQRHMKHKSHDWNTFYQQHTTNFFKDRHYLQQDFPKELQHTNDSKTLVEIGCGVGNALLPLVTDDCCWTVWGLDFSQVAIEILKQQERFLKASKEGRAYANVWDISIPSSGNKPWFHVAHVTTCLFCLSAVDPKDFFQAAKNIAATLRPGGTLVFRDYGRYDEAQLRLGTSRGKRLSDNFYRKHDGTRVYYFAVEDLKRLFVQQAGLQVLELDYIRRVYCNRATGERRRRVWVQGRFRKANQA